MDAGTLISYAQQRAGRVDSGFDDRTLNFLNEAVERWAISRPWQSLKRTITTVTTGDRSMVFPDYVAHVAWLCDEDNQNVINYQERWDRDHPGAYLGDSTGNPDFWREAEVASVYRQPTTPAQISFLSTASGESFSVHITGLIQDTAVSGTAGEYYFGEEVCVASGSTCISSNLYQDIISVGKTGTTGGYVKVRQGSTELAKIAPRRWSAKYRKVEFLTIPGAGITYRCGVIIEPPKLTRETHVPHPSINNEYLIWYAAGLIHKAQGDTQIAEVCLARANRIMNRDDQQEKTAGDRDWNAAPDQMYWGSERSWP
jgi:hypothetical protein